MTYDVLYEKYLKSTDNRKCSRRYINVI